MTLEIFLTLLLFCSTFTAIGTEAVKVTLEERDITYYANTLAGIVAIITAILVGVAYVAFFGCAVTAQLIVCLVALVILSWIGAMVGYDKIIQTITQIKKG